MKDFETTLKERLDRRAATVHPLADVGDLDTRIDTARRRRARMIGSAVAGVCVALVATVAVATMQTDEKPNVAASEEGANSSLPPEATTVPPTTSGPTPTSTDQQIPGGGTTPTSAAPGVNAPDDPDAAKAEIVAAYKLVLEAGASDEQRTALVTSVEGLQAMWDAVKNTPQFADFALVRVSVDDIMFTSQDAAYVYYSFTSTDQVKYPGKMSLIGGAVFVDGRWKIARDSVCDAATRLAEVAGLDLACDPRPPNEIPPTSIGGDRPADPAQATADIETLYFNVYGTFGLSDSARLALVQDSSGLQAVIDKQRADGTEQHATLIPGSVQFISATRAQLGVRLDSLPDTPLFAEAVYTNNTWKVPRSTFCWLSQHMGTPCPEDIDD